MSDDEESITNFEQRATVWKAGFDVPPYQDYIAPAIPYDNKNPTVLGHKYETQKGISAGDRYQKQAKLQELYLKIIPNEKILARDLADEDELVIFKTSTTSTYYKNNYVQKFKQLNQQISILKELDN